MKKGMQYVMFKKLEEICLKHGAKMEQQAGFVKVTGDVAGATLYIGKGAKSKPETAQVSRVDVKGLKHAQTEEFKVVYPDKDLPTGKVTHCIDFRTPRTEVQILASFDAILADCLFAAKPKPAAEPEQAPAEEQAPATEEVAA